MVDPAFQAVPGLLIEIYNSVLKKEDKQKINPLKLGRSAYTNLSTLKTHAFSP